MLFLLLAVAYALPVSILRNGYPEYSFYSGPQVLLFGDNSTNAMECLNDDNNNDNVSATCFNCVYNSSLTCECFFKNVQVEKYRIECKSTTTGKAYYVCDGNCTLYYQTKKYQNNDVYVNEFLSFVMLMLSMISLLSLL